MMSFDPVSVGQAAYAIYRTASPAIEGSGIGVILIAVLTAIRRHPYFRGLRAVSAENRMLRELRDVHISQITMLQTRAELAEETNAALKTSIQELRDALKAEIEAVRTEMASEIADLKHKTVVQTRYIFNLFAALNKAVPPVDTPPIPEELRDELQDGLQGSKA